MMRRYRFYEEYLDDGRRQSAGNVIAIHLDGSFVKEGGVCVNAVAAYPDNGEPNSPVVARLCNAEYLGRSCKLVSEGQAREIHPKLFEYLDALC